MILVPTVHGNGPYVPVVQVNAKLFVLGPQFATILEALSEAQRAIEDIRDADRSKGFDDILAALP